MLGPVDVKAVYTWIADEQVISMDLQIGEWKGLSMILYDPSEDKIKMWGANSFGGNGQAVLRIQGSDIIWTNTVSDSNGNRSVEDFAYVKKSDTKMYVRYVDQMDGQEKQILNEKVQ